MFDDQLNKNQAPGNLPISEPEDILASTEGGVDASGAVSRQPTALERGILKPKAENAPAENPAMPQQPPTMVTPPAEIYQVKEPVLTRGIITVVVVLVVLGILGGGGWWIYNSFIKSSLPGSQTTDTAVVSETAVQTPDEEIISDQVVAPEEAMEPAPVAVEEITTTEGGLENVAKEMADEQVLFGEPIDKDADGLDDSKELELSTDPNNWDTDGDALSDGDEVLVWKTNPLNPDTDGDSYKDGSEVKNGYNPNGSGKIFEVPTEKK